MVENTRETDIKNSRSISLIFSSVVFQPKKRHKSKSLRDQARTGLTYHSFLFGLRFHMCPQKVAFQTLTQAPETVTLPFRFTKNSYSPSNYILPG